MRWLSYGPDEIRPLRHGRRRCGGSRTGRMRSGPYATGAADAGGSRTGRMRSGPYAKARQMPAALVGAGHVRPALVELGELLGHVEEIARRAVVGDVEDRRLRVRVDRDDRARRLHAGEMLNRARDAEGEVDLRLHGL